MQRRLFNTFLLWGLISTFYSTAQIDPGPNPGDTSSVVFSYQNKQVRHTTVRGKDGKVWLQQDLGSSRVALNSKDTNAYGDYFQWGRWDDGHQKKNSAVLAASTLNPNNPSAISAGSDKFYNGWWNGGLITDTWTNNPPTANNGKDPCAAIGAGWRMPTIQDWKDFVTAETMKDDTAGAFKTTLKLVPAGYRGATGIVSSVMSEGTYWSSTNNSNASAYIMQFTSGFSPYSTTGVTGTGNFMARSHGFCIRCVKNCQKIDSVDVVICSYETYTRPGGAVVNESGTYIDIVGETSAKCDSVIVTNLFVVPPISLDGINGEDTICAGESYTYRLPEVSGAAKYVWRLPNDWTGSSDSSAIQITSKNEGTTEIGVYVVTLCGDSTKLITLDVYVSAPEAEITIDEQTLGLTKEFKTYQWYLDGDPIPDATEPTYTVLKNGIYTVSVTDEHGCSDYSDEYKVTSITNITDIDRVRQQIKVYPNRAKDAIRVLSPVEVSVTITTIEGKILKRANKVTQSIPLEEMAEGLYFIHITDKNGNLIKVAQFIKTR